MAHRSLTFAARNGASHRPAKLNGLPVFDAPNDSPAITNKRVRQLLDAAAF